MNMLITIIFVLSTGAPAKNAAVTCDGVSTYVAGDDGQVPIAGAELVLDTRGALIISGQPGTIACYAYDDGYLWMGSIVMKKHGQRVRIVLRKDY